MSTTDDPSPTDHDDQQVARANATDRVPVDGDTGAVAGKSALRDAVSRVWAGEPAGTLHLTLNAVGGWRISERRIDIGG